MSWQLNVYSTVLKCFFFQTTFVSHYIKYSLYIYNMVQTVRSLYTLDPIHNKTPTLPYAYVESTDKPEMWVNQWPSSIQMDTICNPNSNIDERVALNDESLWKINFRAACFTLSNLGQGFSWPRLKAGTLQFSKFRLHFMFNFKWSQFNMKNVKDALFLVLGICAFKK